MQRLAQSSANHVLRAGLADVEGANVLASLSCGVLQASPFGQQARSGHWQVKPDKHKYKHEESLVAWAARQAAVRPRTLFAQRPHGGDGPVRNPYSKLREPKPWAAVYGPFIERATQLRPENKNRKQWDRSHARQLQVLRDAWTRKYNSWRNQERRRADAEARWQLRDSMHRAAVRGKYAFAHEHGIEVKRKLANAQYGPQRPRKRREEPDRDQVIDSLAGEGGA